MPTHVLGLSYFYHDSTAALLRDGEIVAACQEERLSRKRHDSGFPSRAVKYVLREAGISPEQLDAVGFYDKPLLKFERMLSTYVATFPRSFNSFRKAMPVWIKEKLWVPSIIRKGRVWGELHRPDNRRTMATLRRLDRALAASPQQQEEARLAAGRWDEFIEFVANGGESVDDFFDKAACDEW